MNFPATIITTNLGWNSLVLDQNTMHGIHQLKLKPGSKILFCGSPGTGKKLTAMLLGKAGGLDVYSVDLSMLLSKYIGETEKNISVFFSEAAGKNWILFFDEADALFGKRTTVKDSHDKYANQEIAYLLQRIEDFSGIIILATNRKQNIDEAFTRRLQSIIYFNKK